ncbi:MAG: hypothetical protein ACMUFK_05330 [Thermoplasmatota archaeon]
MEEDGADTARTKEILKAFEKALPSVKEEKKVEEAFEKFEQMLKMLEEKTIKGEKGASKIVKDAAPSDHGTIKESIESISDKLRVLMSDFIRAGEMERIREIEKRFSECLKLQKEAAPEGMKNILTSMKDIQDQAEKLHGQLTEDLTIMTNSSLSKVEDMINEISGEQDTASLKEELGETRGLLFDGDIIDAWNKTQELVLKVESENNTTDFRKLEALLLSVGPLMGKIEASEGAASRIYLKLKKDQDSIIEMASKEPKRALESMNIFLDRISAEAAEIEEKPIRDIQKRISELRSRAEDISKFIETSAVLKILEKADSLVLDGALDEAGTLLKKAETALSRLKEERANEIASLRIEEIKVAMTVMEKKGLDVSPLKGPLNDAQRSMKEHNMEQFEKNMSMIDQKLLYISNEEMKIEYQRNLTKIMNQMKILRDDGQEVEDLETELDEMRSLYLDREYEEAVKVSGTLLDRISPRHFYSVIDKRKQMVEETIMEADALGLDVTSSREKLSRAIELIKAKEPEKAVDLLIEAQVELEERMTRRMFSAVETEIVDLASQCKDHGLEVGDINEHISTAYSLADEGKNKEALEHLIGLRESLAIKESVFKVKDLIREISDLIRQGRFLGMEVSQYKAILTKSRVLMEVGDTNGAHDLLDRVIKKLSVKIDERKTLQDKMDKLRGNLLAQKGKVSRLERSGVAVDGFKKRIQNITALIDSLDHQNAENALAEMDTEINELLTASPEQLKKVMVSTIMEEQAPKPVSEEMPPSKSGRKEQVSEDDRARTELFTLIPKIKVEIMKMHSKGMETEDYKRDIETIQNLVIQRQYIRALELGRDCFSRMTSRA